MINKHRIKAGKKDDISEIEEYIEEYIDEYFWENP